MCVCVVFGCENSQKVTKCQAEMPFSQLFKSKHSGRLGQFSAKHKSIAVSSCVTLLLETPPMTERAIMASLFSFLPGFRHVFITNKFRTPELF